MTAPRPPSRHQTLWLSSLVLLLLSLPALLLIPAGLIWIWQQELIYPWLALLVSLTLAGYLLTRRLHRRLLPTAASQDKPALQPPITPPDDDWSPQDLAAWQSVQQLAQQTDSSILASRTLLQQSAREVIEQVARHYYPEHRDPVWNFTLPEALLLTERISQQLRRVLLNHVPAAHLVQVGQVLRLWEYREGSMRLYRGASLAWRMARLVNPVSALLAEARERLLGVAYDETTEYLKQRGARIWLEEVGRAAIELYSGRLQLDADRLEAAALADRNTTPPPGPVQVVIAGQINTGKSSLINLLLKESQADVDLLPSTDRCARYALKQGEETQAVLIDTPGVDDDTTLDALVSSCVEADCLIWVVGAHRADRALDRRALDRVRDWFRANPTRSMPPLLVVASHVDRLSPAREWAPPYDLIARSQPKAAVMVDALEQIARDLNLPDTDLVPIRLDQGAEAYNIDLLQALLQEKLEQAKAGRSQRLRWLARRTDWKKVLRQARGSGRLIRQLLKG